MYKVHMFAGVIRKSLSGCVYVESGLNTHGWEPEIQLLFFWPYNIIIDFHCISLFYLILYISVNASTAME